MELIGSKIILEPVYQETKTNWRRWRGSLKGGWALEEHFEEHGQELARDEQNIFCMSPSLLDAGRARFIIY